MKKYQICSYCVMDTTDPNIEFNDIGRCNHCLSAENLLKKNWIHGEKGDATLVKAVREIKKLSSGQRYDCIVGMSGGIDSSYLLHFVSVEMGLNPLVVHVDAGWNSSEATHNIRQMTEKLNLDLQVFKIDWEEMASLQIAYLKASIANQDVPQDHAFFAKLYEIAVKNNIKSVITGSNLTSESILPASWGYNAMDSIQIKDIYYKFTGKSLKKYPLVGYFKYKIYYPYIYKMRVYRPLNWINYNKNDAIEFLKNNYDWVYYGGKHHESIWTRFFQAYYLPEKFGFDKRRAHLSSMIAAKQLSRESALRELELPAYDLSLFESDIQHISEKLGIDEVEFLEYLELPNREYKSYKNQEKLDSFFRKIKKMTFRNE